jgi:DNA-binding CsgD family transcriptional regulator
LNTALFTDDGPRRIREDRDVSGAQTLHDARAAFDGGAWAEAFAGLTAAEAETPLEPDDLDRLSTAAYLIGKDEASVQARTRAHAGFLERGQHVEAAGSAVWLALTLANVPDQRAQAAGWLARAQRLIDSVKEPCVERGWLLCALARQRVGEGDIPSAHSLFSEAVTIAQRFASRDLMALALHGQGRTLLHLNRKSEGLSLLDEVMVAVSGGEVMPIVAGAVYCSVISACHDLFDLGRAQEWTTALQGWCDSHPDVVPFRGECLIRRSELLQLHGAWPDAISEAQRACDRLTQASRQRPDGGAAFYQIAELHRLRGDVAKADEAYRLASRAGHSPQPGLALLRLSQGQPKAADASIRLALQERGSDRSRVLLLRAAVDIMLACENVSDARAASHGLAELAARIDAPFVRAVSSQASGAVTLAEGNPAEALGALHEADKAWESLAAPYERARVRILIGQAHRQLGDQDGAQLEFDAAHEAFEWLGASADATAAAAYARQSISRGTTNLTGREVEVLRLIATGATNRAIASQLAISEKTVARHVSNIFDKLGLASRTAATAYAYTHKLL